LIDDVKDCKLAENSAQLGLSGGDRY